MEENAVEKVSPPAVVVQWIGDAKRGHLRLLDQTRLPEHVEFIDCKDAQMVWDAIRRLAVRAPAIGVAAGYGMVVAAQFIPDGPDFLTGVEAAAEYLESSRPTAVNLSWAARRILRRAQAASGMGVPPVRQAGVSPARNERGSRSDGGQDPRQTRSPYGRAISEDAIRDAMLDEARAIHAEDEAMCLAIGRNAVSLVQKCAGVLTHCNAGALATAGIGTATAGIYLAHARGHNFTVYCDETRPLLQGARLTAWELMAGGVDAVLITDNMAAQVMREGKVQMVIVGADRIAANGDAANKIGTYGVAILAHRHNIPFYVAAPYSTFDLNLASGAAIPIEQRASEEITQGFGRRTAPHNVRTYSPAFDVTPAELITGIITDRGIISPVTTENVAKLLSRPKA